MIRLLTHRVCFGIDNFGTDQREGEIIALTKEEEARMVQTRQAEYVEAAVASPPENASRKITPMKRR